MPNLQQTVSTVCSKGPRRFSKNKPLTEAIALKAQVTAALCKLQKMALEFLTGTILMGSASACKLQMGYLQLASPKILKRIGSAGPRSTTSLPDTLLRRSSGQYNFDFNTQD